MDQDRAIQLNVAVVRDHVQHVLDMVDRAGPEELKTLLQDFFRFQLDLALL